MMGLYNTEVTKSFCQVCENTCTFRQVRKSIVDLTKG